MICRVCGFDNEDSNAYCDKCGMKLDTKNLRPNINQVSIENKDGDVFQEKPVNISKAKETAEKVSVFCKCGQKLKSGWKYCPKCKKEINVNINLVNDAIEKQERLESNYILAYFLSLLSCVFTSIFGFALANIIIVTARIKFPKNKIIKKIFIIDIIYVIIVVLFLVFFIIWCNEVVSRPSGNCGSLGIDIPRLD